MPIESYLSADDLELGSELLEKGYIVRKCENLGFLNKLRTTVLETSNEWLQSHDALSLIDDLSRSHHHISPAVINEIRLYVFAHLNTSEDIRLSYFQLASLLIQRVVGNDLAMQNKVNLSIQQPHDQSSVLELHSDVWSGDSPFQIVLWTPLTDSTSSNAMFLLAPQESQEALYRARTGELRSMAEIHNAYESKLNPIEVKFGEVLLFDSNCLHGNQLNLTSLSRWSLNCRFTSLLAPATTPERKLGPYYTPIMVRPATQMGLRALKALGLS